LNQQMLGTTLLRLRVGLFDYAFGKNRENLHSALLRKNWKEIDVMVFRALQKGYMEILSNTEFIKFGRRPEVASDISYIFIILSELDKFGYVLHFKSSDP
jgi:hypothetical protein